MSTTTTNYALVKPAVNDPTDADLWGGYLNDDLDDIDAELYTTKGVPTVSKTANYTIVASDKGKMILCDATSGGFTITLLAAATAGNGYKLTVKKTDSSANAITVDGNGLETIDGATTQTLAAQYDTIEIVCDGSNWRVIMKTVTAGLTTRTYYTSGSGNYTTIAGKTTARVIVAAAGGGGGSGGAIGGNASDGGDTTATYGATTVTASGGLGGYNHQGAGSGAGLAHSTATNGDINIRGGGGVGGMAGVNGNNAVGDGTNGGLAIKDFTIAIPGTDTIAYSIGAAGAGDPTSPAGGNGAGGYVIIEQ